MMTLKKTLKNFFQLSAISATLLTSLLAVSTAHAIDYPLPAANSRLVGDNAFYRVQANNETLEDIAARFQLGLTNMLEANPETDPYLPKAGSQLIIPHQLILPDTPREGVVINLAEMRLYYYPKGEKIVRVLPIGIGQIGTDTPENWVTQVYRKRANPTWTPTERMHKEAAARGEALPRVRPAGPDNPMGLFAIYVGNLYAIHGTNANFGIGLRVSQGCVRLRDRDIETLFNTVPVGTRVQFVNHPIKVTDEPDGRRYLEVHEPLSRTQAEFNSNEPVPLSLSKALQTQLERDDTDSFILKRALEERNGLPMWVNP